MGNEEEPKKYMYIVDFWQDGSSDLHDPVEERKVRGDVTITSDHDIHNEAEAEAVYAEGKAAVEALGWRASVIQISPVYVREYHEKA